MQIRLKHETIEPKRIVVKLGTRQITDLEHINKQNIEKLVKEVVDLKTKGYEIILTVSGAVGLGRYSFDHQEDTQLSIPEKQAYAGVGQVKLMHELDHAFSQYGLHVGQVLLTHTIFDHRGAYLNARNTLNTMLGLNIIPVINENDSVAVEEIKLGDNDRLGALVSLLVDADLYIILSDIDGFFTDFGTEKACLIREVNLDEDKEILKHAGQPEQHYSTGGMHTKLDAASMTTLSGIPMVIANGFQPDILNSVLDNLKSGTIFVSNKLNLSAKKRWITGKRIKGKVIIDQGAGQAIIKHKSLLASGIAGIEGKFEAGASISILNEELQEIARGLCNYSSRELSLIAGKNSSEFEDLLGYPNRYDSVVHIDNMVILGN
jgi:glutamate 5-kinase